MYHSYLASRLLSVAHTLVQRSKTLVQRCTHACSALQTRLYSVTNRLFSVAHTLVQRCKPACTALRIACSALQALVQRPSPSTHPRLHMHVAAPPPCHHWDPLPPRRHACATPHGQHRLNVCRLSTFHMNAQLATPQLVTTPWVSLTFGLF